MDAPRRHLVLHAPGLALKSFLAAVHQPSYASGNLEVYVDLDGSVRLAIAGDTIDNRLLGSLLGPVMDKLNALDLVGKGGPSEVRCLAVRIDARHGSARSDLWR